MPALAAKTAAEDIAAATTELRASVLVMAREEEDEDDSQQQPAVSRHIPGGQTHWIYSDGAVVVLIANAIVIDAEPKTHILTTPNQTN